MRRQFVYLGVLAMLLSACGGSDGPAAVIESYADAYKAGDIDAIVAVFADDAVITGHPTGNYDGIDEIRALHSEEADGTVAYKFFNFTVESNTVTWDHLWGDIDENGEVTDGFCVDGHTAVVQDGKITSWKWPPTDFEC